MAVQLGALVLDVVARVGSFTSGMDKAERSAKDAGKGIKGSMGDADGGLKGVIKTAENFKLALTGIVGAVAGAAIASGTFLAGLALDSAKADMNLMVLSDRIKVSVEDIQKITGAAKIFGIEQDQVGSILADVQEKIGEFTATGGGGAADFFDMLKNNTSMTAAEIEGLGKVISGKDGVQAIQSMKDYMDELGATSQEQRFVFESLASDLGNLMPLFADGGSILETYGDQLEEAGVIKTRDAVEQSAMLAAQQMELENKIAGVKNQIASGLSPVMSSLISHVVESTSNFINMEAAMQIVSAGAKIVGGSIIVVMGVIKHASIIINGFFNQVRAIADTAGAISMAEGIGGKLKAASTLGARSFAYLGESAKDITGNLRDTVLAVDSLARTDLTKPSKQVDGMAASIMALTKANRENAKTGGIKTSTAAADAAAASGSGASSLAKERQRAAEAERREAAKRAAELEKEKQKLIESYLTDDEKLYKDHTEALIALKKHGLTAQYAEELRSFEATKALRQAEMDFEIESFALTEAERKKRQHEIDILKIESDKGISAEQREARIASIKDQMDKETAEYRKAQDKQLKDHKRYIINMQQDMELARLAGKDDIESRVQILRIQKERSLSGSSEEEIGYISRIDESDLSDEDKFAAKLEAQKSFEDQRRQIISDSLEEERRMREQDETDRINSQLDMYGTMAGLLMGFVDKNSDAYKLLFAAQKAATVASILLSSKEALAKAWASAPFPANLAAVGMVLAETGTLSATAEAIGLNGMAHSGIDSIPKEGTWLLDEGERVLSPRQNSDLTRFLSNQQAASQPQSSTPQNIKILNSLDPNMMRNFMRTPDGEKLIINAIKENSTQVSKIIGR